MDSVCGTVLGGVLSFFAYITLWFVYNDSHLYKRLIGVVSLFILSLVLIYLRFGKIALLYIVRNNSIDGYLLNYFEVLGNFNNIHFVERILDGAI